MIPLSGTCDYHRSYPRFLPRTFRPLFVFTAVISRFSSFLLGDLATKNSWLLEFVTKRPTTSFRFTLSGPKTISALIHLGSISLDLRLLPRVVILEHSSGHCFRRLCAKKGFFLGDSKDRGGGFVRFVERSDIEIRLFTWYFFLNHNWDIFRLI